jgi:hypothetical protein
MARTHFFCLGVLSRIPPLEHRVLYLNYKYLVNTFQKAGHLLRSRLELLHRLNPKKCLTAFQEVADTCRRFWPMKTPKCTRWSLLANFWLVLIDIIRPIYSTLYDDSLMSHMGGLGVIHGTVVLGFVQRVQRRTGIKRLLRHSIQINSKGPQNSSKRPLFDIFYGRLKSPP